MAGDPRAIVVGGSVGGLFAAVLLHRIGFDVTVYERSVAGMRGRGAGLVAQPDVSRILHEIGADSVAATGVEAYERIVLDRAGDVVQRMPTPQSQMSWDMLYDAFLRKLPAECYRTGHRVKSVYSEGGRACVQLMDGTSDEADLVIGADGIGSEVRKFVAPGTLPRYAGYVAFRGLAPETELPLGSAAVLSGRFAFYNLPRAQVLGYLVAGADGSITPGRRRYNWVWHRPRTSEQMHEALTDAAGGEHTYSMPPGLLSPETVDDLHADARSLLPSVFADVILNEPSPFLQAICDYEAPIMRRGRVILLGDAAYVVRPHTAMGVSKAAGDAMALRDCILDNENLCDALKTYEFIRSVEGKRIAAYGQRLGAQFG